MFSLRCLWLSWPLNTFVTNMASTTTVGGTSRNIAALRVLISDPRLIRVQSKCKFWGQTTNLQYAWGHQPPGCVIYEEKLWLNNVITIKNTSYSIEKYIFCNEILFIVLRFHKWNGVTWWPRDKDYIYVLPKGHYFCSWEMTTRISIFAYILNNNIYI